MLPVCLLFKLQTQLSSYSSPATIERFLYLGKMYRARRGKEGKIYREKREKGRKEGEFFSTGSFWRKSGTPRPLAHYMHILLIQLITRFKRSELVWIPFGVDCGLPIGYWSNIGGLLLQLKAINSISYVSWQLHPSFKMERIYADFRVPTQLV